MWTHRRCFQGLPVGLMRLKARYLPVCLVLKKQVSVRVDPQGIFLRAPVDLTAQKARCLLLRLEPKRQVSVDLRTHRGCFQGASIDLMAYKDGLCHRLHHGSCLHDPAFNSDNSTMASKNLSKRSASFDNDYLVGIGSNFWHQKSGGVSTLPSSRVHGIADGIDHDIYEARTTKSKEPWSHLDVVGSNKTRPGSTARNVRRADPRSTRAEACSSVAESRD